MHKHACFLSTAIMLLAPQIDADCKPEIPEEIESNSFYACIGGSIEDLDKAPANAEKIHISEMLVGRIPEFMFKRFNQSLEELECRSCQITDIDDRTFSKLTQLQKLNLFGNGVMKVRAAWFTNLTNLRHLLLDSNKIEVVEDYAFSNLTNLFALSMMENNLKKITAKWFGDTVVPVQFLLFDLNEIDDIGANTFSRLSNLYALDLSDNNLGNVKVDWFGNTIPMKKLHMRNNKIVDFDSELIRRAINLTFLDISGNKLKCSEIKSIDKHRLERICSN